jgi:hypothetical protein
MVTNETLVSARPDLLHGSSVHTSWRPGGREAVELVGRVSKWPPNWSFLHILLDLYFSRTARTDSITIRECSSSFGVQASVRVTVRNGARTDECAVLAGCACRLRARCSSGATLTITAALPLLGPYHYWAMLPLLLALPILGWPYHYRAELPLLGCSTIGSVPAQWRVFA